MRHPTLSRSSIRVLVVDDCRPIANVIASILEANFYDVRMACGAEEALEIAEEFRPHALITDVILPNMDGFALAAESKRRYPDCRVLLMSAGYRGTPKNQNGLRVVPKESVRQEAFRLLEICRESAKN